MVKSSIGTMVDLEVGVYGPEGEEQFREIKAGLVKPEIGTIIDLEVGRESEEQLRKIKVGAVEPTIGTEAVSPGPVACVPRRREVWMNVSAASIITLIPILHLFDEPGGNLFLGIAFLINMIYLGLLFYVGYLGDPTPYTFRQLMIQLLESALVVFCSSWTYYFRDVQIGVTLLGMSLVFNVIPMLNVWCCFVNIGYDDCFLIIVIDLVLLQFRYYGVVAYTVVSCTCVALLLIKDPFRRYCSNKIKRRIVYGKLVI